MTVNRKSLLWPGNPFADKTYTIQTAGKLGKIKTQRSLRFCKQSNYCDFSINFKKLLTIREKSLPSLVFNENGP
jgi:hypothetical protein